MAEMLGEIDVANGAQLRALGAVEAYRRLQFRFGRQVSLNALYAMAAGLEDRDWRDLSAAEKAALKAAADS